MVHVLRLRKASNSKKLYRALVAALVCIATLLPTAQATSIAYQSLDQIVQASDHVLAGKVTHVDMVDGRGRQVREENARTGPGLDNRIRLQLEVQDVLLSACRRPPRRVLIELWGMWHYTLGDIREQVEGSDGVFLLSGPDFTPAYPQDFQRDASEREEIERLAKARRLQIAPGTMECSKDQPL